MVIEQLQKVWEKYPFLKVILVPRHPERFDEVYQLLNSQKIPAVRYSSLSTVSDLGGEKVILMDAMGKLRLCYQISHLALVAGSYVERVGGHNILEPLYYGVPSFFGPHVQNQPDMVDLVNKANCGGVVQMADLVSLIEKMINHKKQRKELGECGLKLVSSLHGSSKRTWNAIEKAIEEKMK
jgi:3-deoxy-D-manno-octulosonic-acid transferase